jgi:hypothetical protein
MPRRRDILLPAVLEYVQRRKCALTLDVANTFGVNDDRAYHILQTLQDIGEVCTIKVGAINIWCIRGADVDDPFVAAMPCLGKVRDVLEDVARSGKGGVVSVSTVRVTAEVAKRCKIPPSFVLQTAVRNYLPLLFTAAGIPYTYTERTSRYIVPRVKLSNLAGIRIPVALQCARRRRSAHRTNGLTTVTFKLPYSLLVELDRLASQLAMHRSDVIRRAIELYLRNAPAQPAQGGGEVGEVEGVEEMPVVRGRV